MIAFATAKGAPHLRTWLENVYPLYLHELSEFDAQYRLDEHGRFEPDYLPYWLDEETAQPLVLTEDDLPFGFAFVGTGAFPFKSAHVDHRMCEFFAVRQVRGTGRAEAAATAVLTSYRGIWEVTEVEANRRALRFWRRVIGRFSGGDFRETAKSGEVRQEFVSQDVTP